MALVITFSAIGRSALALASVVTMPSAATSDATRLAIISRWCGELPPNRRPFFGVAGMAVLSSFARSDRPRSSSFCDHLVERLLAEVGDGQQVVLALARAARRWC